MKIKRLTQEKLERMAHAETREKFAKKEIIMIKLTVVRETTGKYLKIIDATLLKCILEKTIQTLALLN